MAAPLYAVLASAYALVGAGVSALYIYGHRQRVQPGTHLATAAVLFVSTGVVVLLSLDDPGVWELSQVGLRFCAFFAAALFWTPAIIYIVIHYWGMLVERILQPGSRQHPPSGPRTNKEWWDLLRETLEALGEHPGNARLRLPQLLSGVATSCPNRQQDIQRI